MPPNLILDANNNDLIERIVYFKIARTTVTRNYVVNTHITIEQFIKKIKRKVRREFQMQNIELVEAGQDAVNAEEAPALSISEYSKIFRDKYNNVSNIAFYIRPIVDTIVVHECCVCWNHVQSPTAYFQCAHTICNQCFQGCHNNNIHTCPTCRSVLI